MSKVISIIVCILLISSQVSAEAAIIYAPTKPKEVTEIQVDNRIIPEDQSGGPSSAVSTIGSSLVSDPLFQDYTNIYKLYEDSNGNLYVKQNSTTYVKNAWRKVDTRSFEKIGADTKGFNHSYNWVYCGNNGKLLKASSGKMKRYLIDGQPYAFNEYGQMLEGYFNDEGEMWEDNQYSDPFELLNGSNYLYYADPNNGILKTGWLQFRDNTDKYEWKENIWLYFNPSNYRSIRSNSDNKYKLQKIGSKQFAFDSNGVMLTGFDAMRYELDDGQTIKYFNSDGSIVTNGFVKVDWEDEIMEDYFSDYDNYDEDISIYLNKSGKLYKDQVKKINSSYYGFDTNGIVLKNCLGLYSSGHYVDAISIDNTDAREFIINNKYVNKNGENHVYDGVSTIYYFDNSGKRQNSGKLEFSDETYTYGAANNGAYENNRNGYFYVHGLMMKPVDEKYGIYIQNPDKTVYSSSELYGNSKAYVVNNSGKKLNSGAYKDDNDYYWLVSTSGNLLGVYSCKVKNNQYYSTNKEGKETWIPFGTTDRNGRTEKNFLVKLYSDSALNFTIRN